MRRRFGRANVIHIGYVEKHTEASISWRWSGDSNRDVRTLFTGTYGWVRLQATAVLGCEDDAAAAASQGVGNKKRRISLGRSSLPSPVGSRQGHLAAGALHPFLSPFPSCHLRSFALTSLFASLAPSLPPFQLPPNHVSPVIVRKSILRPLRLTMTPRGFKICLAKVFEHLA